MRIALVVSQLPPDTFGGVESVALGLARALSELGVEVVIVAGRAVDNETSHGRLVSENFEGLPVVRLGVNLALPPAENGALKTENRMLSAFDIALGKIAPSLVHVLQLGILSPTIRHALASRNVPMVYTVTNYEAICAYTTLVHRDGSLCDGTASVQKCLDCRRHHSPAADVVRTAMAVVPTSQWPAMAKLSSRVLGRSVGVLDVGVDSRQRQIMWRDWLRRAAHIVAPSEWVRQVLLSNGMSSRQISLVPHGLDTSAAGSGSPSHGATPLRMGFVGRFHPVKGLHFLIEAVRTLPVDCLVELHVHGSGGPHEREYEAQVRTLADSSDRIHFHGAFDRSSMSDVYGSIDVLAVPSLWHEVYGMIVLEAAHHRVPVLASEIGGLPEVVRAQNAGQLVPPGDMAAWQAAMARFAENRTALRQMAASIRRPRDVRDEARDLQSVYDMVGRQ